MADLNRIEELIKDKVKVVGDNSFKLSKHQSEATDKLIKLCRFQKGLLLWHTMGSGKTITAWNIANNLPIKDSAGNEHKRIILGPEGLDISWKNDGKFLGIINEMDHTDPHSLYTGLTVKTTKESIDIPPNKERSLYDNIVNYTNPIYYSYSDIKNINTELLENMKNSIIICDEAHNLVKVLRDLLNSPFDEDKLKAKRFISSLDSIFKIILLTGTPINTDSKSQIAPLINIAAGEYVLPASDIEIEQLLIPSVEHLKIQESILNRQIERARKQKIREQDNKDEEGIMKSIRNWVGNVGPVISKNITRVRNIIVPGIPSKKRHFGELVLVTGLTLLGSGVTLLSGGVVLVGGVLVISIDNKLVTVKRNDIDTNFTQSISDKDRLNFIKRQIEEMQNDVDEKKFAKIISPYISFYDYKVNGVYIDLWKFPHSSNELTILNPNDFRLETSSEGIDNAFISSQELLKIEENIELYKKNKYRWRYGIIGGVTILGAGAIFFLSGGLIPTLPALLTLKGAGASAALAGWLGYEWNYGSKFADVEEASKQIAKYKKYREKIRNVVKKVDQSFDENVSSVNNNINTYLKSYNKAHIPWTQYQLYLFYKYISRDLNANYGIDLNLTLNEATLLDKIDILADNIGIDKTGISTANKNLDLEDNYLKYNFTRIIGNISYDLEYFGTIMGFPGKSGNQVFIPIPTKNSLNDLLILNNTFSNYFTRILTTPENRNGTRNINIKNIQTSGYGYKNYKINLVDDKYLFTDDIELTTAQIQEIITSIDNDNRRLNEFLNQIQDDYNIDYNNIIPVENITKFCHISPFYCDENSGEMKHRKKLLQWIKEYKNIIIRSKIQYYCIPKDRGIFGKGIEIESLVDRLSIHQKNLLKTINNVNTFNIFNNNKFTDLINNLTNSECSPEISVSRENNFYLPTVYSNFEHYGFELISAYLTYKGLNHITFHNIMNDRVKSNLSNLSKIPFITMTQNTARISEIDQDPELNKKFINTYSNDNINDFFGIDNHRSIEIDDNYSSIIKFTNKVRCIAAESVDKDIIKDFLKNVGNRKTDCTQYADEQENCNNAKGCRYINSSNRHAAAGECLPIDHQGSQEDIKTSDDDNDTDIRIDEEGSYLINGTIDTYDNVIFEYFIKDNNITEEIKNKLGFNRLNEYKGFDINYDDFSVVAAVRGDDNVPGDEYIFKIENNKSGNINFLDNSEFYHNTPVCVLLHNKLTEGIDLPMSPAIHVLEMPDNYGKAGQIYARILRNISSKKPYSFINMINNYMRQAEVINSIPGLVIDEASGLINNISIQDAINRLKDENNRIIQENEGYLTLEDKNTIKSNKKNILKLGKFYSFIYKSVKTIEQCKSMTIGSKTYNDTYKKYKLIDYCCDKIVDNGQIINKKNSYKLDDYCSIYINFDEDERCTINSEIEDGVIKKFSTTLAQIDNVTDELRELVADMNNTDNIVLNIENNNIILEVKFNKADLETLFIGDLDLGETSYNPNTNPINRCMKKVYQYCMSYKENENYLLSNYELRQRRLVTLYLNNKSNDSDFEIDEDDLDILLAYINKTYPKTIKNKIEGPNIIDYNNIDVIKQNVNYKKIVNFIKSKKAIWNRSNPEIERLEGEIISLNLAFTEYKTESEKWIIDSRIDYLQEPDKSQEYTYLYNLYDEILKTESRKGTDLVTYPSRSRENYRTRLGIISNKLRNLTHSNNTTSVYYKSVIKRIILGNPEFDADFLVNFVINLISDAKLNLSWRVNIPQFNIDVNFFNGNFLKGQKLSPIMSINEKKKQFLNGSKVLKEEHNEIKYQIMNDIISTNYTNIDWNLVLGEFMEDDDVVEEQQENSDIEDISYVNRKLSKAFSKYYDNYMNDNNLFQYLDAETSIIENQINKQREFFEELQNNLTTSDKTECGSGTIKPIDLSMDNLDFIKRDDNNIVLKFNKHIPNIQTTINNTITISGLRNNGLDKLNSNNEYNTYKVLGYNMINYELSLRIQNKNNALNKVIRSWPVNTSKNENFTLDTELYFGNFDNLKEYLCTNSTNYISQTIDNLEDNINENNDFIDRLYRSLVIIKKTIEVQYINDFKNDYKLMEQIHNEFLTWRWSYDKTIFPQGFYYFFENFANMKSLVYSKLTSFSSQEKKILMLIDLCLSTMSPYKTALDNDILVDNCNNSYTEKSIEQNIIINQSYRKELYNQLVNLNKEIRQYKVSFPTVNRPNCFDTENNETDIQCNYAYECVDIVKFQNDKKYRESIKNMNYSLCKKDDNVSNTNNIIFRNISSIWEEVKELPKDKANKIFSRKFRNRKIKLYNSNNKRTNYDKYISVIESLILQLHRYTVNFSIKFKIECNEWKYNSLTNRDVLKNDSPEKASFCINKQIGGDFKENLDSEDLNNFITETLRNHYLLNNNYRFEEALDKLNKKLKQHYHFSQTDFSTISLKVTNDLLNSSSESKLETVPGLLDGVKLDLFYVDKVGIKTIQQDIIPQENTSFDVNIYLWLQGKQYINIHNDDELLDDSVVSNNIDMFRYMIRSVKEARNFINSSIINDYKAAFNKDKRRIYEYISWWLSNYESNNSYDEIRDETKDYITDMLSGFTGEKDLCFVPVSLGIFIQNSDVPMYSVDMSMDDFDFSNDLFNIKKINIENLVDSKYVFRLYKRDLKQNLSFSKLVNFNYNFYSNDYLSSNPYQISSYSIVPIFKCLDFPNSLFAFTDIKKEIKFVLNNIEVTTKLFEVKNIGYTIYNGNIENSYNLNNFNDDDKIISDIEDKFIKIMVEDTSYKELS